MKAFWQTACGVLAALVLSMGLQGCGSDSSHSGGSCDYWDGTWTGNEVDSYGTDLGPITFTVQGNQVNIDVSRYNSDPELLTMTGSCNDSVVPHQITATITGGNHPEAVGAPLYGIYELDKTAMSGRIAFHRPGLTTFPAAFTASSIERIFVFVQSDAGIAGAGGN